ncbi:MULTISPECIES: TRAP transporter substrate-binding protein [Ramlibacter]|uniref:DctP family TRAP transporter solute-binding subunit n=1 Tax=Ramlibacter pinisoli TaxID=2682844 RepID=A0A6N8IYB0_9BURK|nr:MULTISPECIES: TRAP transporter substrate-binding protein [Ramlibacter]MBA2962058.1 TRAP transporter substrate-binding protein [Ramlibacter sp. CGMCC 1.13660]MVQ32001.1 DctP family TRAP transporter solute-binding subunit [Ramlibacter pinisoli]
MKTRLAVVALAALAALALPAQAQFQDRSLRLSVPVPKEHPMGQGARTMIACAAEKSGGKLKVNPTYDGALGNDVAATQSARSGTLDMYITSTAPLVGVLPSIGVFDLPFLFSNEKEADAVLDGKAGAYFSEKLMGVGLVNLAWWENGFRHATNSKHPIQRAEDFQGVKMRVMQNNIFIDTFRTLGSNAVPMAFSEVYSALETRTVDGQENPFANIENSKFYEVQKYLTLTKHAYSPLAVLMSKKTWDGLSPPERAAMMECAAKGRDDERRINRESAAASLANLKSKGMQVNEISPAEMQRIRDKAQVVYQTHAKSIGDEAMNLVSGELKRIRGQ